MRATTATSVYSLGTATLGSPKCSPRVDTGSSHRRPNNLSAARNCSAVPSRKACLQLSLAAAPDIKRATPDPAPRRATPANGQEQRKNTYLHRSPRGQVGSKAAADTGEQQLMMVPTTRPLVGCFGPKRLSTAIVRASIFT
eukprot:6492748-Amphidinium_carterae.1